MIVTPRAAQGEPHEGAANHIDLVVDVIRDHQILVHVTRNEIRDRQQAGRHQRAHINLFRMKDGVALVVPGKSARSELIVQEILA